MLKKKFKNTKVGIIPFDWDCVPFSSVFKRIVNPVKVNVNQEYKEIGIRSHGKGIFHKEAIKGKKLGSKRVFWLEPHAIVFNIVFAWEQAVAITSDEEKGMIGSHRFPMYKSVEGICEENFILCFFKSKRGKLGLELASPGGAGRNKTLGQNELDFLYIPVPPIAEQRKIVEILSAWDRMVSFYDAIIISKKQEYISFRQRYLTGKYRISGFHGKWQAARLGDLLTEHGMLSSGKEEVCSVSVNKGVVNQCQHLGRVYAASDTSNYNLVKPGDIIYTKSPTGEYPFGIVKQSLAPCNVIVSPLYGVFTPVTFELGTIIDFYFESSVNANNYLRPIIQKGAKNTINITNRTFLAGELSLPNDVAEQKVIAKIITMKRREIELLEKIRDKYNQHKRGLMQKLLTGKIRVKV